MQRNNLTFSRAAIALPTTTSQLLYQNVMIRQLQLVSTKNTLNKLLCSLSFTTAHIRGIQELN